MKKRVVLSLVLVALALLSACQPKTVIVEKQVEVTSVVTQVVKETVKETVVVEGTPKVVEKEVTKVVEAVVTATPEPTQVATVSSYRNSWSSAAEIIAVAGCRGLS